MLQPRLKVRALGVPRAAPGALSTTLCASVSPLAASLGGQRGVPTPGGCFWVQPHAPLCPSPFRTPPCGLMSLSLCRIRPHSRCAPPQHSPDWHGVSHPASSTARAPWQHPMFPCQGAAGPPPALLPASWAREEGGNTVEKNQTLPVALLPRGWAAQTAALRHAATSERAEELKKIHGRQFGSHLCLAWDVQG